MSDGGLIQATGWPRRWFRLAVHVLVLLAVAWGVRRTIASALDQLDDFPWHVQPQWLVAAGGLYLLGMLPMGLFWYSSLQAMGQRPALLPTMRAYYIGHLGKYVPGKAMVVVLRAGLLRGRQVQMSVAAASVFLETLTMMAVGAFLAVGILCVWLYRYLPGDDYLLPLAIGLWLMSGLPTLPPVFRRLALRLGVARGDPQIEQKLQGVNYPLMATGWIAMAAGWLLLALSLWAVMRALGIEGLHPVADLPYYTAAVTLSVVAGFLSLIPGGVLVREMILTTILGEIYFGHVVQIPLAGATALSVAVVLRLVGLTAELLLALLLYFVIRHAPRATPTEAD
ncbi:MAG: hypothetical protein GTO53_11275 [Planctomycetales bacterium]|nr:hypothetical protein [Planctomycetales bacterium]NIM09697.1 hypothetical protein [Planctomycetales bacterium]NIN09174.1 hypothetical protein [Planctomycetales bacterium]NIN78279.1 hypothetical protein [Planctomycetales bacterium]NIO35470.1 hypothetical protein [Planctomycetales bacterium]